MNKRILSLLLCFSIFLSGFVFLSQKDKKSQMSYLNPKQVIEKYFEYYNHKDLKKMNSLATKNHQFSSSTLKNLEYIKIIHIKEVADQEQKEIYLRSRHKNKIINFEKEKLDLKNIAIFMVTFEVKYSKNVFTSNDSGRYGYNYTLIRKDKNSPWLIDSAGY